MAINRLDNALCYSKFNIVKTKKILFEMYYKQLMRYLMKIVKINKLPDSMPENDVKFLIFSLGYITVGNADDNKTYAFEGGLGGEPNAYYLPTISVVANAGLKFDKTFTIDKDCVIVKCDSMYQGFNSIISAYSALLATIDISLYWSTVNSRTQNLYESGNDDIKKSIEDTFKNLEDGDKLTAIASKPLFDFIKTRDFSGPNVSVNIKSLIELKQYIKASYFMTIGLPSNYNMKRESLNENELDADIYTITPLMDDVIDTLNEDFAKVNKMFGYEISVERVSSLEKVNKDIENREKEEELDIELNEAEIDQIEKQTEESEDDKSNQEEIIEDKTENVEENKEGE